MHNSVTAILDLTLGIFKAAQLRRHCQAYLAPKI